MGAVFSLAYGVAAYAVSLVTLLYLIGFSGNLLVPKSIDSGTGASWAAALGIDLALLGLFAVQHSVMARPAFKAWWTQMVPPAVERSTYLVAACIALAVLYLLWVPIAEPVVWRLQSGASIALAWALFAAGWLILLVSTFLINHFELFGLQQVVARFAGRPVPPVQFKTPLLYRWVRHPIYLGVLLGIWSTPVMTAGHLLFALGISAYVLIGIAFEERDLIARFGERYLRYRAEVGMLLPRSRSARTDGSPTSHYLRR